MPIVLKNSCAKAKKATSSGQRDVSFSLFRESEARIAELFDLYDAEADPQTRGLLIEELCELLTAHVTLLTFYFYPAVMDVLGSNQEHCAKVIQRYALFKQLMTELTTVLPGCTVYEEKIVLLKSHFEYHAKEEETLVFPKIQKSHLDLHELGGALLKAKQSLDVELKLAATKRNQKH